MTAPCRLYLITPPAFDPDVFADRLARALDGGAIACLQIRLKPADDEAIARAAEALLPLAQSRGVAVLINDRPDLAVRLGADGVHIGQDDASYADARKLMGKERIVGVTCHASRHLAMIAGEAGADYVAFGAFFPTSTKAVIHHADPEILAWWSDLFEVPCVAIGGITVRNAGPLIAAGADFLAVSSGVWDHPAGPRAAVAAFEKLIGSFPP